MSLPTSFFIGRGSGGIDVGTLTEHYQANTAAGLQRVMFNNVEYLLNYAKYNSKGWVEVLFHGNVAEGHHTRANFYQSMNSGYGLRSENRVGTGTYAGKALDYTADFSQIMLGYNIYPTDAAVTSKSSRTIASIAATGQNQGNALPLILSVDMQGGTSSSTGVAPARQSFLDFFTGVEEGMSGFYNNPVLSGVNGSHSYEAYWNKGGYRFAINLFNRNGGHQTDHWQIASGEDSSSSTYFANIGYRGQAGGSWTSRNVGSWDTYTNNSGPFSSIYQITNSNVLSIWLTDM